MLTWVWHKWGVYDKFDKCRILSRYYPVRGGITSIQHIEI